MEGNELKVTLVTWTNNPVKAIASQVKNMLGDMVHDLDEISEEEALKILGELKKTSLGGALETLDLVFQIENIPRAITHQIVRHRVGATYHQESLRFALKTDGFEYEIGPTITDPEEFEKLMATILEYYKKEIENGAETQDARGVLPINTLTKIGFKVNFKTLIHMSHVRLCYQSQPFWKKLMGLMKKEIGEKVHPELAEFLKPACQVSGRCEFKSVFDRKCPVEETLIMNVCRGCSMFAFECPGYFNGRGCKAITTFMRLEENKNAKEE